MPRTARSAALALTTALALCVSAVDARAELDPFERASDPSCYVLRVDPEDRWGKAAELTLSTADGIALWTRRVEPSPWDAVVLPDGTSAACSLSMLWIFAPDGSVRLERKVLPGFETYLPVCAFQPHVSGLFALPERDALVVRMSLRDTEWWVFDLRTGKELGRASGADSSRATVLHGAPLVLLHERPGTEGVVALIDPLAANRLVWRSAPGEDALLSDRTLDEPRRFELVSAKRGERRLFEVEPDPADATGWRVRELERAPWEPPIPAPEREPELPEPELVDLFPLGGASLQAPGGEWEAAVGARIVDVHFDPAGRWLVLGKNEPTVHVFDESGRPLRAMSPSGLRLAKYWHHSASLSSQPDGVVLLQVQVEGRSFREMRRYVRVVFSRDGEQLSVEDITATSDREWNRPDGFAWTSDAETVRLLAPSGEVLREIAHRADGSWMGWSPDTVLAPDGSLLAFDTRHSLAGFLSGEVTILSSDGEIVASLPATDGRYHLAFDGQWIVERNSGGLDLQRIADGRHFRFEPPGVGYARPFLSRARELQLFDMEDRRVLRYAWPPDVPVREGER